MKDELTIGLDGGSRLAILAVDCTSAAAELARAHLSGPAASVYLAQALAGAALLGAETSLPDETVTFRLDCPGPLEGFLAECTEKGTLRGYTKKKILDDLDVERFKDADAIGASAHVEVIRSVPGKVLSSGAADVSFGASGAVATAMETYFSQSLQRRARFAFFGSAGEDGIAVAARGLMVECPPDGDEDAFRRVSALFESGAAAKAIAGATCSFRTLLRKLDLALAEVRSTRPLSFACRCSRERAQAMLDAMPAADREGLPAKVDVTCHLCGRTWTVDNGG